MLTPLEINSCLERILPTVQKPGRYTGGEFNQVVKDWNSVQTHLALVFPDIYDLGMSNLGLAILYDQVNQRPDALAERAYAPWTDMEAPCAQHGIPLYSLESKHPLAEFDIIGLSAALRNTLHQHAQPPRPGWHSAASARARRSHHPLVIAGGHAAFNPEPMHAFIDAFVIGEGEEVIHEIVETHQAWKQRRDGPAEPAARPGRHPGRVCPISVRGALPSRWDVCSHIEKRLIEAPPAGGQAHRRQTAPAADPFPRALYRHRAQPHADRDHARLHARLPLLPGRDDHPPGARAPGGRDHRRDRSSRWPAPASRRSACSPCPPLTIRISSSWSRRSASALPAATCRSRLPSLRIEIGLGRSDGRREGLRAAAASPWRPKPPPSACARSSTSRSAPQQLLDTARADLLARLAQHQAVLHDRPPLRDTRRCAGDRRSVQGGAGGRAQSHRQARQVHAGVSTFVPKPHTPFQWAPCDTLEQIREKQALLKRQLARRRIEAHLELSPRRPCWKPGYRAATGAWPR